MNTLMQNLARSGKFFQLPYVECIIDSVTTYICYIFAMGRVSRYKKEKATIRNFGVLKNADKYNDAPSSSSKKKSRGKFQDINGFTLEPDRGRKMIKKAKHFKAQQQNSKTKTQTASFSKMKLKPGESLREFSHRVDKEARGVVADKSHSQTSTAVRRKNFMKEKSKKNKLKKKAKRSRGKRKTTSDDESELVSSPCKKILIISLTNKKFGTKIYRGELSPKKRSKNTSKTGNQSLATRRVGLHDVAVQPPDLASFKQRKE